MIILLIYGGASSEHDVSIKSKDYIKQILTSLGYKTKELFITKDGTYLYQNKEVSIIPNKGFFIDLKKIEFDVAFPILHGINGEDGNIQALLEIINVPYISEGIMTSAIGMNKAIFHDLLKNRFPVIPSKRIKTIDDIDKNKYVLKVSNGGSSIGVYLVENKDAIDTEALINELKKLDDNIIMQPWIEEARELELGVIKDLEYDCEIVLGPVEIKKQNQFFSYDDKYNDLNLKILTRDELILDKEIILKLRELAKDVYNSLEGTMYMRVDFLLSKDGAIYLNEVNTIPGLTRTSHFIVLAKEIGFDNLFKLLINNALISYKRKNHGKSPILSC